MEETPKQSERVTRGSYARRLDNAPLRAKVAVLVLGAMVLGVLLGMIESAMGNMLWPLVVGMTFGGGAMIVLGQHWLSLPFDRLAERLERLAEKKTDVLQRDLPLSRMDEVGRIARVFHTILLGARHEGNEAKRLRRTMDTRVSDATKRATQSLRVMAMRDGLTGLGNRRFLDEQLPAMVAATREAEDELVCVLLDLDNFKNVNDTLGHAAGDGLLTLVGDLLKGSTRDTDIAARLGGDEFVVLMPGADAARGRELADNLRSLFRQQTRTANPEGPHADVSAGVAAMNAEGCVTGEMLLELADAHLYEAKRAGKGQTYVSAKAA